MILVLFENPSQRILPIYHVAAKAELARRGECSSVHVPGSTPGLQPITIPSRARARMRRRARPWRRSRPWRNRRRRCRCGVGLGVAVGVGIGVTGRTRSRCGSHGRGESWRCTGCWCWTGRAHTKHVNKTSDRLLVPLVGCLHPGDEEATFVLVGDYRAASWKLDCAGKNVHCFAEQESIRRQQLHPNSTRIESVHLTR